MPQALPALKIIGAVFSAIGSSYIVRTILINVALGALSRALTKKPGYNKPAINVTVRSTVENRKLVFGSPRCGGAVVFYDVSGDNNKFLWYVIAYAGHQCSAIKDVWLDTIRISNSGIGGGAAAGGAVTTGQFANKLWIYKYTGTSAQNVDPNLNAAKAQWTATHRLRGTCYAVVKMERDDTAYPNGAPQNITALIDGALLYDSRLDSTNGGTGTHRRTDPTTWEFGTIGRNPALIWRWYVSGGSGHNDSTTRLIRYGLRESDSRIPDSLVAAAANECDETLSGSYAPPSGSQSRYRCDLEVSCGENRGDIIEHILATMAGTHVVVHGQHRLYAGAYDAPTHAFTEADLYGQLEVEDTLDHGRRYNAVAPVYRNAAKEYTEATGIFRTDSAYETQDGGKRIPLEIELRGVTDQYQAQRLAEIKLRQSRMMRSVKLVGALNLLRVAPHETLTFSHARYSWSGRIFRCAERQLDFGEEAGRVILTCQREDSAVYADMLTADYDAGTSTTDTFTNETPDAVTNVRTTGLQNSILLQWDRAAQTFPGTSYEARESTAYAMTSPTTIYQGADLQTVIGKIVSSDFYYQVRAIRNGQASAWAPASNGVLGKVASLIAALSGSVSPGTATSSGGATSQTTNSVTVTPAGGTSPYTYAWTWQSGGTSITTDSATAATTTFSATGLTTGETRTGQAKCTITDNLSATYTVFVDVSISRPAPTITVPSISLFSGAISPNDASCAFKFDNDGRWYSSETTAAPTTDRGLWCDPPEYAGDYEIRITRTGGSETVFTSGPTLGTYHALSTDREWRLTETGTGSRDILSTIDIRTIAGPGTPVTTTGNSASVTVEI